VGDNLDNCPNDLNPDQLNHDLPCRSIALPEQDSLN
jgi:hypothetical protein